MSFQETDDTYTYLYKPAWSDTILVAYRSGSRPTTRKDHESPAFKNNKLDSLPVISWSDSLPQTWLTHDGFTLPLRTTRAYREDAGPPTNRSTLDRKLLHLYEEKSGYKEDPTHLREVSAEALKASRFILADDLPDLGI